ncbi:MAG TPA: lipoyl(octanoyl) transferase LipB [Chloroflexota bacterium]|nr:lipoyl(octanoyl) transferase LipB [Chloroflexota bacterium]
MSATVSADTATPVEKVSIDREPPPCRVAFLGRVPYQEAWDLQRSLAVRRVADEIPDTLLLLEHPHTFTIGRTGDPANILIAGDQLAALGAEVFDIDRGGDVTYHGPGQLVGYPIMLVEDRRDLLQYIRNLEESIILALADFGIQGGGIPGLSGVWIGNDKIAAIGVKMGRVTSHGFALNVTTDLSYFGHIVPCGIRGRGVTSMAEQKAASTQSTDREMLSPESGARGTNGDQGELEVSVESVASSVSNAFGQVFGRRILVLDRFDANALLASG